MYVVKVQALINPFSKKIERSEWDNSRYHPGPGFCDGQVTDEHTVEYRLGAALVQDGDYGPYIHVSATIPIPAELVPEIIGYVAETDAPTERAQTGRYELHTAVGWVAVKDYDRTRIVIKVQGENREDVMALLSAIAAGNEKPVVLWDGTAPSQAPVATPLKTVDENASLSLVRDTDISSGQEDPMEAMRAITERHR